MYIQTVPPHVYKALAVAARHEGLLANGYSKAEADQVVTQEAIATFPEFADEALEGSEHMLMYDLLERMNYEARLGDFCVMSLEEIHVDVCNFYDVDPENNSRYFD